MIDGVFIAAVFAATAALALQIGSAVTTFIDSRGVGDSDEPDAVTRKRLRELVWPLAILAAIAVFIAFGTDAAARFVWDDGNAALGLGVLLATATAAFLVGVTGVVAIVRRERPTYARLRRDLRDRSTFTVSGEELADFESRLERADLLRARRPRAGLVLKIVGLVIVVVVGGVLTVALALAGSALMWVFIAGVAVEVGAFVVDLRAGVVLRARVEAVLEAQREEVVAMLERARIPQRGRVPGLRDRVTRALAILREKQR